MLALYTGARREELAQLHVQDVRQVDGLWVLDINKEPDSKGELQKKVENASAVRLIPLHPVLAETLRFPDYVESVRRQGHERVFPLLKKVRTNFGHSFGSRFAKFKQTLSLEPSKGNKDFHSLRHTFSNYFKQNRLQGDEFSQVFGHKNQKLAAERYGDRFPVGTIYDRVIAKLDYGIDLAHLATSKFIPPVDAD